MIAPPCAGPAPPPVPAPQPAPLQPAAGSGGSTGVAGWNHGVATPSRLPAGTGAAARARPPPDANGLRASAAWSNGSGVGSKARKRLSAGLVCSIVVSWKRVVALSITTRVPAD